MIHGPVEPPTEPIDDASVLAQGDLVRLPGRKTVYVFHEAVPSGKDGVRVQEGPRSLALEVTVSVEAMARAAFGERPGLSAKMLSLLDCRWKVAAPPLERLTDPVPYLRLAPVCRLVVTLLAWHARDPAIEGARHGWSLSSEVAAAIRDAAPRS